SQESDMHDSDIDKEDKRIDLNVPASGRIKLSMQYSRVQEVATLAVKILLSTICMKDAVPDGPAKMLDYARRSLIKAAEHLGYQAIVYRLKREKYYWRKLASIPIQRVSNFRGKIKRVTDNLVPSFYDLEPGDIPKIRWLQDKLRYIYPTRYESNHVDGRAAYSIKIFVKVLRITLFHKTHSFGFELATHFSSSLPDEPDELEIPAPLLALVATAIHASIEDQKHTHSDPGDFKTNVYLDVYQSHIDVLDEIKTKKLMAYHNLMHSIYELV
ncbi:hypothetical protein BD309DRAFT_825257, partial [Dichomitus squalens]